VLPPKRGQLMMVPNGVRPQLQRTAIEVYFCHTFRNLQSFYLWTDIIFSKELNIICSLSDAYMYLRNNLQTSTQWHAAYLVLFTCSCILCMGGYCLHDVMLLVCVSVCLPQKHCIWLWGWVHLLCSALQIFLFLLLFLLYYVNVYWKRN